MSDTSHRKHLQSLQRAQDREREVFKHFVTHLRSRMIRCPSCRAQSRLHKYGFVRTFWYQAPHGCTEGDIWFVDKIEDCLIICPKCKARPRISDVIDGHKISNAHEEHLIQAEELFDHVYEQHGSNPMKRVHPPL